MSSVFITAVINKYTEDGIFIYIAGKGYTPAAQTDKWEAIKQKSITDNSGMTLSDNFAGWLFKHTDKGYLPITPVDVINN